jgi:broad specificity phosphatase PhoE
MNLIFTRHGESQANIERIISNRELPHPLTAKGRTQAIALAEQLTADDLIAIYASPILRAQQTAQIIGEGLNLPFTIHEALREFDCGMMEGRADAAAWAAHEAVVATWAAGDYAQRIPGGESFVDMQTRFVPFVNQLVSQFANHTGAVLLISHGSLLHHMLPLVLRNVDAAFVKQHPLRNCACVRGLVTPDGITCSTWDNHQL